MYNEYNITHIHRKLVTSVNTREDSPISQIYEECD